MKAAYHWLNEVTFNFYVRTVSMTALGVARVVIETVSFYLFFCREWLHDLSTQIF